MIFSILYWFSLVRGEDVENVNGVRGDNVTLTCQLTELDQEARSWMVGSDSGSVKLVAYGNKGFLSDIEVGLNDASQYTLKIIGVQQTEDGMWHCQQNNQIRKKIRLAVDVKPYIDPITTHALQAGDDATLICVAQGQPRPKLTWTFNNKTIDASETIDREDRNGQQRIQSTLVVNGIKKSAIQSYGCRAENRAGRAEKFTDIFIKEPPKIIKESQNGYEEVKYAKVGDQAMMVCISKGYPTPKITWTAPNNSRISEEDPNGKFKACVQRQNHKKYGQMTIANLLITSVDKGDFGLYKCRFENSMGSVHNNVYLKPPAQPRTEPTSESAMIQSSTSIVLISNISLLVFLLQ